MSDERSDRDYDDCHDWDDCDDNGLGGLSWSEFMASLNGPLDLPWYYPESW